MSANSFWNEAVETLSADAQFALNEEGFLRTLAYVADASPFYREKFQTAGIEPSRIGSLRDIARLPFTRKGELREAQRRDPPVGAHRACPPERVARIYSSSGTTGIPTYIGLTSRDIHEVQAEAIARFCWAGGIRPGSVAVNIPTAPFIADCFREGIEKVGATHVPTGFNSDRVVAAFRYQGADALHSTVSFWSHLLDELEERNIEPAELGLRRIVGGAEGGTRVVRPRVEEAFGATVIEGMGMGEMTCVVFGECAEDRGAGMHYLAQGLVHAELVDPETGDSVEIRAGATGELVYSALRSEAMPLLRYRSGDHVRVLSTERCRCGRTGFRIEALGRTDDMITVLGVNVYPIAVRDVVATLKPRVTGRVEVQLEEPGPAVAPPVRIKVELGDEPGAPDELTARLEGLLRDSLFFRARVELVDHLPRYQYKTKLVNKAYEEGP